MVGGSRNRALTGPGSPLPFWRASTREVLRCLMEGLRWAPQELPVRSLVERIGDQDGVVAFGAGGKLRNRCFDQFLDQADVLHSIGRKIGP